METIDISLTVAQQNTLESLEGEELLMFIQALASQLTMNISPALNIDNIDDIRDTVESFLEWKYITNNN